MKNTLLVFITLFSFVGFAQDVNMQDGMSSQCAGMFFDSGGPGAVYGNNETLSYTICPDSADAAIQLDFSVFSTQQNADIMTIYDGDTNAGLVLAMVSGQNLDPFMVRASEINLTGCLTIEFTSNGAGAFDGWEAAISCFRPCQVITPQIDSVTPSVVVDDVIRTCLGDNLTFVGSGMFANGDDQNAVYDWTFGNGDTATGQTVDYIYAASGGYEIGLTITDEFNCTSETVTQILQVATEPDFTGTMAADTEICLGESTDLTGVVNPVDFIVECTPPVAGTTFLPDGNGVSYETCIDVECFQEGQTLDNINDLLEICMNIEHSYLGDLLMQITSPSGQTVFLKSTAGVGLGGGSIFLGGPIDNDNNLDPGQGEDYCFTNTATQLIYNGPTENNGTPPGPSIVPGNYMSETPLSALLGTELNGQWCLTITDTLGSDNGYIFSWLLNFDPSIIPPDQSFTPVVTNEEWLADPTITATNGNLITVTPDAAGQKCYTYQAQDDYGCTYEEIVCIDVLPSPIANDPQDLFICDTTGNTVGTFDLTENDDDVLGGQDPTLFNVTYHETPEAADTGTPEIPNPDAYMNTLNPQPIYVRIEDNSGQCAAINDFEIGISTIDVGVLENLEDCDNGTPDRAAFDLTENDDNALNGLDPLLYSVTYYESQMAANDGMPAITNPSLYGNTMNPQTIYVRVQDVNNMDCFDAESFFTLTVNYQPVIAAEPIPLTECVDDMGNVTFNLEENTPIVLGTQNPFQVGVSYHTSQDDADTGNMPIMNTGAYVQIMNPQRIFVRVANIAEQECDATSFFEIESFDVRMGELDDLFACDEGSNGTAIFDLTENDDNALDGQSGIDYTVTYYDNPGDASTGNMPIMTPDMYTNTMNPQRIYVRIENDRNTTCSETDFFDIEATPSAPINDPDPIEICDTDNDGFAEFDLESRTNQIAIGNPDLIVTYHPTMNDAMTGDGDLNSPYGNVMEDTQTIFVRVEDNVNGCVLFTELQLFVYDSPLLVTPEDIELCDVDEDNVEIFDLTQAETELLDGLDPALYDITYHETLMQAQDNDLPIGDPTMYENVTNPQTIYVRVTDPANTADCNNIVELIIFARPLPEVFDPTPLEVCDDETGVDTEDEVATFDLTSKDDEITGGAANVDVFYYETPADIPNNPIPNPDSYVNTANPQTLEVRIEDEFGCENFETLTLVVNPNPSIADVIFEYELCDIDNDGVEEFDLASQTAMILNGEPDVIITYHATLAEAEMGTDAIDDTLPYQNTEANVDDIYIRATNQFTLCFVTRQLNLIITASPVIEMLEDLFVCDDDDDGEAIFDLTINTSNALGSQTDITVTYHETEQEAMDGAMPIAMPQMYENVTNPQEIWIRLEGDITTCATIDSFMITVEALPVVINPSALRVCNDDYDNPAIAIFDLTSKNEEITGLTPVPATITVMFYESQADLDMDNPIMNPSMYQNTQNNQTVFIEVIDTATMGQCSDTTTMTLTVLPLPSPSSTNEDGELDQESCDDSDGVIDNMAMFDLTESGDVIAMGENVDLSYHTSEQDALDNVSPIPNPDMYVTITRTIWVRVENGNQDNECSVLVSFEVTVNPNPMLTAMEYTAALCEPEDATPGITAFDNAEVTNNLVPDLLATPIVDFTVTYHFTQMDADSGNNPIPDGFIFDQTINNPVFIRVVDNVGDTQCYNSDNLAELTINIDTEPTLGGPAEDIFLCADAASDQETSTMFDLTVNNATIDASGNPDTQVLYYASQMDFDNGNPIPDADTMMYTNLSNPQTIIAELFNPMTGCRSNGTVMFDLIVQPLPVLPDDLQMPQGDIVCTDSLGNVVTPFDIGYDLGASDGFEYTYDWTPDNVDADNDGSEDAIYTITTLNQTTTYSVVITRVNDPGNGMPNCSNGLNENGQPYRVTFEPSSAPFGAIATVTEAYFNESGEYTVTVTPVDSSGAPLPVEDYLYRIDDGPAQVSNVFTGILFGSHIAYAIDIEGCGETGDPFTIIDYPRFFTPNSDGFNDTWNIAGIEGQPAAKIYIFDRHGKLIKQLSPTSQGWDGTFNGRQLPSSDYWFSVEYDEPTDGTRRTFKANFTLKR